MGRYVGFRWTVDDSFRSGILEVNNTESYLTNGAYRQSAGKPDDIMDLDVSILMRMWTDYEINCDKVKTDVMDYANANKDGSRNVGVNYGKKFDK